MKKIELGEKQKKIIARPFTHTLEVNEGTPRSSKTTAGHFRYARYLLETEDQNHLVAAYNMEQAIRLFGEGDGTGLFHIFEGFYDLKNDDMGYYMELHTPKGIRNIFFKGGGKANSVGAITGMSLGSVVFCEINLLHMDFIQECFRRTFAAKNRYHLADLNPPSPNHPVIKKVFEVQDMYWEHWTPNDNPILSEKRKEEIRNVLKKNPYLYKRDWLGQRTIAQGVIYSMFSDEQNILENIPGKPIEMFFTADGGQSDATSCACNIVVYDEGKYKLCRVAHYYHSGKKERETKAMSTYAKEIKAFMKHCINKYKTVPYTDIFVDPACLSLREELHLLNIQTRKADNNAHDKVKSSVGIEVGIERLQNMMSERLFLLIKDDDNYHHNNFLSELEMYIRLDNGKPIDDFNHSLDECRYSNNYFFKKYIKE